MQYAQILVNTKSDILDKTYTYLIPYELLAKISIGCLVDVPFGTRFKKGIIFKIVRKVPKNIQGKLKPIKSLIYDFPIISPYQLYLAEKISKYYLANLSQVVFFMAPDLSKRKVKDKNITFKPYIKKNYPETIYTIYDAKHQRIKHYIKLINKAITNNKSVMLLFPDYAANENFINNIKKNFKDTIVLDPGSSLSQKTDIFLQLQTNKPKIIIGTRNTILHSIDNIGLIIVDDFTHFGYKEEQSIYYHSYTVARMISQLTGAKIVLGDAYPSAMFYHNSPKALCNKITYFTNLQIRLLNVSADKDLTIGYNLEMLINQSIKKQQKILLIAGKNVNAAGFVCQECKNIFYCPKCDRVLNQINPQDHYLTCPVCNYHLPIPDKCPQCNSAKLTSFGSTTHKVQQVVNRLFPDIKTKILKTDADYGKQYFNDYHIFIADLYASNWQNLSFDNSALISFDEMKINPSYNTNINIIKKILNIAEITNNVLCIQTVEPEDELLNQIVSKNINKILDAELKLYQQFGYPPFRKFIKISYRNNNKNEVYKIISNLLSKIKKTLPEQIRCRVTTGKKTRDKYSSSIVLDVEISNYLKLLSYLLKNYQQLGLSRYLIDVEPLRLI